MFTASHAGNIPHPCMCVLLFRALRGVTKPCHVWEDMEQPLGHRHCQLAQGHAQVLPSAMAMGVTLLS